MELSQLSKAAFTQPLLLYIVFSVESVIFTVQTLLCRPWNGFYFALMIVLPFVYEWRLIRDLPFLNFSCITGECPIRSILIYSAKALFTMALCILIPGSLAFFISAKMALNSCWLLFCIYKLSYPRIVLWSAGLLFFAITILLCIEDAVLALSQCIILTIMEYYMTMNCDKSFSDYYKTLKEFIMSFPEPILILNQENSVLFKNQEGFGLIDQIKNTHTEVAEDFTELFLEAKKTGISLKQNIEQFRRDIEGTYQNKLQWSQEYFIEEEVNVAAKLTFTVRSSNATQTRKQEKCYNVTMIWLRNPLLPFLTTGSSDVILIFNDISEKGALKEKKLADNMKSVLISTISHELRTPLNGIIGILDIIYGKLPEGIKAWWNAAHFSAQLLLNTVNCMLDFSQLDMEKFCVHSGYMNLRKAFNELIELFDNVVQKDKVELKQTIAEDVPVTFKTDPARVKQILINLLSNAVNYTFNGSISLSASMADDGALRMEVSDTGVGIPKEAQENLFKLFGNAHDEPSANACKLAGLGLTCSSKLVRELGGNLTVNSKVNVGSTFWFTLKEIPPDSPKLDLRRVRNNSLDVDLRKRRRCRGVSEMEIKLQFDCQPEQRRSALRCILMNQGPSPNGELSIIPQLVPCTSPRNSKKREEGKLTDNGKPISESGSDSDSNSDSSSIKGSIKSKSKSKGSNSYEGSVCEEINLSDDLMKSNINRSISKSGFNFKDGTCRVKALSADILKTSRKVSRVTDVEILVVDDSSINRLVLSGILKNLGYNPKEACNGKEACKLVLNSKLRFDIVLMDVQMPLMDGIEATYKIRQRFDKTVLPIVAVTALSSELELQKCIDAGMNGTMAKPLSLQDVKMIMKRYGLYEGYESL